MRTASVCRKTRETDIQLTLTLEGRGKTDIQTGVGFFDHMLDAMCRFGFMDLTLRCQGDLQVDAHHTVEDTGICIGQALNRALGEKRGIARSGHAYLPMDEALAFAALDLCGRDYLVFEGDFAAPRCGGMDTQLCREFFRAACQQAGLTAHLRILYGENDHHKMEALFKAFGKALAQAATLDPRVEDVHSTKGVLA